LKKGYKLKTNTKRGYDHGVFIPLSIMYPNANIPVIQMSILDSLDP
jgi:aromatic ring-opening dioxygenase catalytic subunit (LigB family)